MSSFHHSYAGEDYLSAVQSMLTRAQHSCAKAFQHLEVPTKCPRSGTIIAVTSATHRV